MKITKEIRDKINPFIDTVPRSTKSLFSSGVPSTSGIYDDDDDDMPDFNPSVPLSVGRVATSEFIEYQSVAKENDE